jgi:hypothetical protein
MPIGMPEHGGLCGPKNDNAIPRIDIPVAFFTNLSQSSRCRGKHDDEPNDY